MMLMIVSLLSVPALAQGPWAVFIDSESASECGVINAANAELVLLRETSELVIVSGADAVLEDTFVNAEGDVFLGDEPMGFVTFAEDGDGFRTVWWVTLTGTTVEIDEFTGQPSAVIDRPEDFTGAYCDACDFWDDSSVCPSGDGVRPLFSLCGSGLGGAATLSLSFVGFTVLRCRGRRRVARR